jgi:hypothetical protein
LEKQQPPSRGFRERESSEGKSIESARHRADGCKRDKENVTYTSRIDKDGDMCVKRRFMIASHVDKIFTGNVPCFFFSDTSLDHPEPV